MRVTVILCIAALVTVCVAWDELDESFVDVFLAIAVLSLFAVGVHAVLYLRCARASPQTRSIGNSHDEEARGHPPAERVRRQPDA